MLREREREREREKNMSMLYCSFIGDDAYAAMIS